MGSRALGPREDKMKKYVLITLLGMSLMACQKSDSGSGSSSGSENGTTHSKTVTINGMSPKEYYDQFLYRVEGDCSHYNHNFYYRYFHLLTSDFNLGTLENGHDLKGETRLFLNNDGTYQAYYEELEIYKYIPDGYEIQKYHEQELSGHWQVTEDGIIIIEGLGTGTALTYNDHPAIDFTYNTDIHSPGLKGKNSLMIKTSSNVGKKQDSCN